MSIPISISVDIAGKEVLELEAVVAVLKVEEIKDNLFAVFPIGATMQDGGKRKRSDGESHASSLSIKRKRKEIQNQEK